MRTISESANYRVKGPLSTIIQPDEVKLLAKGVENGSNGKVTVKFITPDMLREKPDLVGGFHPPTKAGEQGAIYILKDKPTHYEYIHEWFHLQHYLQVLRAPAIKGDIPKAAEYYTSKLRTVDKEAYVFRQMMDERIWKNLDVKERQAAIDYFKSVVNAPKDNRLPSFDEKRDFLKLVEKANSMLRLPHNPHE